jgi:hypothetical protein
VVTTANPICMALDDFYENVDTSDASRELQVLTLSIDSREKPAWF